MVVEKGMVLEEGLMVVAVGVRALWIWVAADCLLMAERAKARAVKEKVVWVD